MHALVADIYSLAGIHRAVRNLIASVSLHIAVPDKIIIMGFFISASRYGRIVTA